MGTSNTDNPLVATGYRLYVEALAKSRESVHELAEKMKESAKEFWTFTGDKKYDLILQQKKNSKFTGNLVDEFEHEFWVQQQSALDRNDLDWFDDNVDFNPEKYKEAYDNKINWEEAYEKVNKKQI